MVIVAVTGAVACVGSVAVMVTCPPGGGASGAVYRPVGSIEPMQSGVEDGQVPVVKLTDHVALLSTTLLNSAVNGWVAPARTVTCPGDILRSPVPLPMPTPIEFDVIVVVEVELELGVSVMIAVMLIFVLGTFWGAV